MLLDLFVYVRVDDVQIEDRSLNLVLEQAPVAVWATDRDLRLIYAHTKMAVLGEGARQAIGGTIQQFLGVQDAADATVAHHLAAVAGQPQSFRYWFRAHCFDIRLEPLKNEDGQITGCIGVALDVTAQEHLEEEFSLTRRRFEEAQQVAHIGTFEWDIAPNRVSWSDEMYRIYGVAKETFLGTYEAFLSVYASR